MSHWSDYDEKSCGLQNRNLKSINAGFSHKAESPADHEARQIISNPIHKAMEILSNPTDDDLDLLEEGKSFGEVKRIRRQRLGIELTPGRCRKVDHEQYKILINKSRLCFVVLNFR